MKRHLIFIILSLLFLQHTHSQIVEIKGKINASLEVEGIHIINKTARRFTISNSDGEFLIPAKMNDTLLISGISYQPKEVVVTSLILASKELTVYLEELVNVLDEVIVGKVLTGDLLSDIRNADLKRPLNFYDLGIPGYTGKLMTQSQRRLHEATSGGGLIPVGLIVNAVTGRTKRLKAQVKLEKLDVCLEKMKSNFSKDLFSKEEWDDGQKTAYFFYCQDDPEFEQWCKRNNDMAIFEFLMAKLQAFKAIVQSEKE